jgi:4a-hydroxytetrahydrobiopterin dehydratase
MSLLSQVEIDQELRTLEGWRFADGALRRQFLFSGFSDAVAFVQRLVPEAEQADHHPDITINYNRVTLAYVTHSAGGVTPKDIAGARMAARVAGGPR